MPIQLSGSLVITGSITTTGGITISGSILSASYSDTASFSNNFRVLGNLTASTALITGTLTAQTLVVQTITSSIEYSSGSNIFGSQLTNTQTFTGSVLITGSIGVNTTTNASRTMQIAQASGSSSALRLIASTGGSALLEFLGDGASTQPTIGVTAAYPNDLSISAGGSTRMFISTNGYVGIGNTSPSEFLTIGDSTNTSTSRRAITLGGSGYGNPGNANTGSNGDKFILFNSATGASGDMRLGVGTLGDLWYKSSAYHRFFLNTTGSTVAEVMRITTGSVGIGTTTPLEVLDVYKAHPTSSGWSARTLTRDENFAAFIGTYWNGTTSVSAVAGHVSALTGWATLYVNTIDGISTNSGNVIVGGFLGMNLTSPLTNLDINARGGVGGWTGIRLKAGTSSVQSLSMGQVTAGNGAWIGMAQYNQSGYWQTEGTAASVLIFGSDGTFSINTDSGLTANTNYNVSARLTIASAGNIGIGVTMANWDSTIKPIEIGNKGTFYGGYNGATPVFYIGANAYYNGGWLYANTNAYKALLLDCGDGNYHFQNAAAGIAGNGITWTSLMKVSSIGAILLGTTTNTSDVRLQVAASGGVASWISGTFAGTGGTDKVVLGNLGGYTGASIGAHTTALNGWAQLNINPGGGAVYAGSVRLDTLSDQRVKDNIQPISGSLNKILQLNGKKFHLKDEPEDKVRYGFIAQDLEGILDEFVINSNRTFTKDDLVVENVKSIESWASSWAALLVEAIKELSAKVTALETK